METNTVGIDVSKDKLDVALWENDTYQLGIFENNKKGHRALVNWLKKKKVEIQRVGIEATGRYGELVTTYLHQQGYSVSVVNPARIKAYGQSQLKRNKTDREDAKVIAHFCATQTPEKWTPSPDYYQELQMMVRHRDSLKAERTRELNRQQSGLSSSFVLKTIKQHIAFLDKQIAQLEKQIQHIIDQHDDLKQQQQLLLSISGIGSITAAKFMAEVPNVKQFQSASQLAAYAGLTPRHHHSGSSVHRRGRMVKTGNKRFRTAFYMAALTAIRHNPIVRALAERLRKRGKAEKVIIGAAMHKLVHLAYGVLKTGLPFDPNYLVNLQVTP